MSENVAKSEHSQQVRNHYNKIKERRRQDRRKSEIIQLRCFNNWMKQVQIEDVIIAYTEICPSSKKDGLQVLDYCCGKGGDQNKWKKSKSII